MNKQAGLSWNKGEENAVPANKAPTQLTLDEMLRSMHVFK
jgi:hypothetical protein